MSHFQLTSNYMIISWGGGRGGQDQDDVDFTGGSRMSQRTLSTPKIHLQTKSMVFMSDSFIFAESFRPNPQVMTFSTSADLALGIQIQNMHSVL